MIGPIDPLVEARERGDRVKASPLMSGMHAILTALAGHDLWMQTIFWLTPNQYLEGETPLARMHQGEVTAVVRAAQQYGEQGCS